MSKRKNALMLATLACAMLILPSCSVTPIESDSTSDSEVKKTYFMISFSAGEGCVISPLEGYDPNKVEQGKDFRFRISTQEGYSVTEVFIDSSGYSLLPDEDGVYSISNIKENITIACSSSINLFRLVFSSGNFMMTPLGEANPNKIPYGSDFSFTLTPNAHNKIVKVAYQGEDLTPDSEGVYTINAIKSSSFVTILAEENTYKIVLPSQEDFTIEMADTTIDLDKVAYSKEVKFKVTPKKYHQVDSVKIGELTLEKGTDGYYVIKNQESDVNVAVSSSIIRCIVTFDSNGASPIDSITQDAGTTLTEPTAPSKTLSDYYDSVSFEGWYSKNGKYDFSSLLEGDTDLVAHYTYGNAKKEIVNNFASSDFTLIEGASISTDFKASFNKATWSKYKGDATALAQLQSDFGRTVDDGVMIHAGANDGSGFTMPAINFKSLLQNGNVIYMESGAFNNWNNVTLNGKRVLYNNGDSSVQVGTSLRNILISFKLGSDGKVMAYFKNILCDTPFNCASDPSSEVALTDAQASGTEGLTFLFAQKGDTRFYWFSKPYIVKAERQVVDFSSLSGYTLTNATSKTAEKLAVQSSKDGMMVACSGASLDSKSVLALNPIDFSEYLENGEGLRFTIGTNASQDEIALLSGENEISLGKNGISPDSETSETREEMGKTWQNWQFDISKAGLFVSNQNEGKEYFVPLSSSVLSGQESLKIRLSSSSESIDKSYIVSNVVAYKA